jgi:hypothetical protein
MSGRKPTRRSAVPVLRQIGHDARCDAFERLRHLRLDDVDERHLRDVSSCERRLGGEPLRQLGADHSRGADDHDVHE